MTRLLRDVRGSTAHAVGAVLAAYTSEMALGSLLFGGLADAWRRPVLLFALLEAAAAIWALSVPPLTAPPRPAGQAPTLQVGAGRADLRARAHRSPAMFVLYNGKQVAETTAPQGPKVGEHVVLGAARPLAFRRLAVYCGLPAPDQPMAGPKPGEILSYLSNGDTVRASQVEFADGYFVFTTEFGPLKVSPDRVVSIAFPAKAEKLPGAGSAAALVETSGSRFALEVDTITSEFVVGKSPDLGEVKLPRRIVRSISFPAS